MKIETKRIQNGTKDKASEGCVFEKECSRIKSGAEALEEKGLTKFRCPIEDKTKEKERGQDWKPHFKTKTFFKPTEVEFKRKKSWTWRKRFGWLVVTVGIYITLKLTFEWYIAGQAVTILDGQTANISYECAQRVLEMCQ